MSDTPPLNVLIAEDHELTRMGLTHALEKSGQVRVVGEAENGEELLSLLNEANLPDVILMDIGMPVMDGITATQKVKSLYATVKVVILTSHNEKEQVLASLSAGADAYCSKDIKADRLLQVLDMVAEGTIWIDPAIAAIVVNVLSGPQPGESAPSTLKTRQKYNTELTERELEVLHHIVSGKANKEIATAMNLSIYTVKAHVCSIIQKLAVDDRTQAAVKALKEGLVNH